MAKQIYHTIYQGDTFEWLILVQDIEGNPLDMSSYVGGTAGARGMIRKSPKDNSALAAFDIYVLTGPEVVAAISEGKYRTDAQTIASLEPFSSGRCYLLVRLDSDITSALPAKRLCFDIEVEDTSRYVFKPCVGFIMVVAACTR